ncbi:MAG: pitrilysin family protein, partial [Eggerthellaceae bacterium]
MSHKTTVLPNGITVITETMPSVRSISLGLWFNVGTRDERADQAGLAHFMEHMMFKGTKSRDAYDISMQFDRLGAEYNAFTSREYTCFYARFVDDKLKAALEILADMVINSTFAQEAINT